ncbi:MAG TPA: DUF4265 domain-containing protein [Candidatus Baltobacteraceae bacterium]|nr:DUF4265 domain-containing protein [Candidatus Baltobacteraceae bacterium]
MADEASCERYELRKIRFDLERAPSDAWPPVRFEALWARRSGDHAYVLDNIPFYVYGVSLGDEVYADDADADGYLSYRRVLRHNGHSTFRMRLTAASPEEDLPFVRDLMKTLCDVGCGTEHDVGGVIAVDAPPGCPLGAVIDVLKLGNEEHVWTYEVGFVFTTEGDP